MPQRTTKPPSELPGDRECQLSLWFCRHGELVWCVNPQQLLHRAQEKRQRRETHRLASLQQRAPLRGYPDVWNGRTAAQQLAEAGCYGQQITPPKEVVSSRRRDARDCRQ
jgi:hypothetical protein